MNVTYGKIIIPTVVASVIAISAIVIFSPYFSSLTSNKLHNTCVHYDAKARIIVISCDSTLSEVNRALANDTLLRKEQVEGIWLLSSSILVSKGAVLKIDLDDGNWIRINSQGKSFEISNSRVVKNLSESTPFHIQVFGGLYLQGVKVTSWDPKLYRYQDQASNGTIPRPYITFEEDAAPSQILNSELAYLGYDSPHKKGFNFYGGENSTIIGNRLHDLWYGFFSTNVGNLIIKNNLVYNNMKYGVDPHMGSHNMIFKNNQIYNNRIGLICSLDCTNVLFENNTIKNNKEIGLMFSRNTVNSTARFNNISLSDIGISVSESHSNHIYANYISKSVDGLAIKNNSSNTLLNNNSILEASHCGIIVTAGANNNSIDHNYISNYKVNGICLAKDASRNFFFANEINGIGQYGINVKDNDATSNTFRNNIILLADSAVRVYDNNKTFFENNKIHNTFSYQYIISGNSTLNLIRTHFLGDLIRAPNTDINMLNISDSGTLVIQSKMKDSNNTKSLRYDTDLKPYVTSLSSVTTSIYSTSP